MGGSLYIIHLDMARFLHGHVLREAHLNISSLERSMELYSLILNMEGVSKGNTLEYELVGSRLTLVETSGARHKPFNAPGLYHIAFTVDSINGLAEVLRRLYKNGIYITGTADHGYTYAIYLSDPDGNGIEVYWDKPWYRGALKTSPLDIREILRFDGDNGYRVSLGHIHLKVGDLRSAEEFYVNRLGMKVTTREYVGALFMSYTDYHHHVAVNTWLTKGGGRWASPGEYIGLVRYTLQPPDQRVMEGIYRDPAGVEVEVVHSW